MLPGSWIGVDLDGVLATQGEWQGLGHIGPPVPRMVERVQHWLRAGVEVRIFTARASHDPTSPEHALAISTIEHWCQQHIGRVLPITCRKDALCVELWDDRAVQVELNAGYPTARQRSWIGSF